MSTPMPDSEDKRSQEYAESVAPHVRRLRLRALRDRQRESLLFLPALMVLGSVVVGVAVSAVDDQPAVKNLPWPIDFAPDVAITLLGTIAGATITTAGVVFSLLVVSLQLASGQFSPRVLRGFWRDRFGQVLIGLLLSTFAFCVLALARINTSAERAPTLTVTLALLLTLASVFSIVIFLDRISRQQYVGSIMRPLLLAELPAQSVRDSHGRTLLTPWDLDHVEYLTHAYDQLRIYAAPHPQVQMALVRTVRMLRTACSTVDNRERVVAKLDEQLALAVEASARAGVHPVDRARVEAETTGQTAPLDGGASTRRSGPQDGTETAG